MADVTTLPTPLERALCRLEAACDARDEVVAQLIEKLEAERLPKSRSRLSVALDGLDDVLRDAKERLGDRIAPVERPRLELVRWSERTTWGGDDA